MNEAGLLGPERMVGGGECVDRESGVMVLGCDHQQSHPMTLTLLTWEPLPDNYMTRCGP